MLSFETISKAWNKFFFEERPVEGMALFRIIWGLILMVNLYYYIGSVEDFYGPQAILSFKTVQQMFPYPHLNILNYFSPTLESVYLLLGFYFLALLGVIVGFYTRTSLIISLICLVSLHHRNIWLLSSADFLLRLITLYLVFSPAGYALSLDKYFNRNSKKYQSGLHAPWVQRLIQIQLSVVYVWTAWHKVKGDAWFDGSAVYYATRLQDFYNFSIPYFMDSKWFLMFMTWSTLALEFGLGTLVWIKELRKPVIISGIIFHLGIEYTMSIPYFEIIMVALLILFFTPEELRKFVQSTKMMFEKMKKHIEVQLELKKPIVE